MRIILMFLFLMILSTGCLRDNTTAPVLILGTDDGYGTYTAEILKAEGWNEFILSSPESEHIDYSYLKQFDLVILSGSLSDTYKEAMISEYVKNGGNLIAFRPDPILGELFGIDNKAGVMTDGELIIDVTTDQGLGLIETPMQFHGKADIYSNVSGSILANMKSESSVVFPAIVSNKYGNGRTVAFLYNLPQSIVYTRQGNPALAGMETDSINGLRAMDLFTGGWLQPSTNVLNQADEQMRLLSRCMGSLIRYPLPRFWYFPDSLRCLVTLTNDGEFSNENDFEPQFRDVDSLKGKMTLYVMETEKVSRNWTEKWTERGFEISGHPDNTNEATHPEWKNVSNVLSGKQEEIFEQYGLAMNTVVNHWFVWCGRDSSGNKDFAAQAAIEAIHGVGMDINYAHYDNNSAEGHFLGPLGFYQGNFTGSGLPMKFASAEGKVLDIYQHLNNVYDQQYMENNDAEGFFECFRGIMDRSIEEEIYSFISIKSHNDEYFFSRTPLMRMLEYANNRNIPVWTASALLDFLRMKDAASFTNIEWSGNSLSFRLISPVKGGGGLTFILPAEFGNKKLDDIKLNGEGTNYFLRSVRSQHFAFVTVTSGNDYDISVSYR